MVSSADEYEITRTKHRGELAMALPDYENSLLMSLGCLTSERTRLLRRLLHTASEHSPWHRKRLRGVNVNNFNEADLQSIPPMTKNDLMTHWNEIVTDNRLSLDLVNAHLSQLKTDRYLLDSFHAVASGGTSGQRGVFVYGWQEWIKLYCAMSRRTPRIHATGIRQRESVEADRTITRASISAEKATHLSCAMSQTFSDPENPTRRFPVTLPVEELVARLNSAQPWHLSGYPSMLYLLVHEARNGKLSISPKTIRAYSEPLYPEIRVALEETWGCDVTNLWGCSEGGIAKSCSFGHGMHISDDLIIVEPVNSDGLPVPAGTPSAKIYLTNLYNETLPLIRYEIGDEITIIDEPCKCGSVFTRIEDVQGRLDEVFVYESGQYIHPHVLRSILGEYPGIIEYQVSQTPRGVNIAVQTTALHFHQLQRAVTHVLHSLGIVRPEVSIIPVDRIPRLETGKLKRFVPLKKRE